MIKIAYLINSVHFGGPGNVLRNIVNNIDIKKYDVTIIILFAQRNDEEIIAEFENEGVRIIRLNFECKIEYMLYGQKRLNELIGQYKFDIVHSHGWCPDILNSKSKSKKKISTLHCNMFEDYERTYGKFKSVFMIKYQLQALKNFDYTVCVSKTVQDSINKYLDNTCVIHNGIEQIKYSKYPSRKELSIPTDATIYIYIGRLTEGKSIIELINAFKENHLPNEYLLIFGRGAEEEKCRQISDHNIRIMGFSNIAVSYMKISNFYISASKSEGFSISVIEALDSGLGLFISDIPSHKEIFDLADKLYIGETFNASNFEQKIAVLRKNKKMIVPEKIKEFKQQILSAEKMVADYTEIYEKLSEG